MELFDTSKYSIAASYDFEFEQSSSKKKGRARFIVDPAWEDGSAFPGISSKNGFKVGSRLRLKHTNRVGIVLNISSSGTGRLKWEEEEEDEREYDLCDTYFEKLPLQTEESDRWNPAHFGSDPSFKADDEQLTIFFDEGQEPPEPDDFKSITEYEEAWKQWENSSNSTCVAGSALASRLQDSKSGDSSSLESQKQTNTAQTSSKKDSQESPTSVTLTSSQPSGDGARHPIVLPPRHPANHLASKGSDSQPKTPATASPQLLESSADANRTTLQSKMSEDSSIADIGKPPTNPTLDFYLATFPASGMMSNGSLYQVEPLERPSLESGCSWLESPSALSSVGRSPGLSRLESSLVKQEILSRGQVVNPIFLEESFGIPPGWTDPSESRAATQLLEEEDRRSAMRLTHEWERSPSEEFSICNQLPVNTTPEKFLEEMEEEEPQRLPEPAAPLRGTSVRAAQSPSKQRGCLYKYLENKKLKDGTIASYPRVIGERSPDNAKHWRWGFNWEEKIDGEWKGRSIGSVPVGAIPMIQSMQKLGVPLEEIISFIRRSKAKK